MDTTKLLASKIYSQKFNVTGSKIKQTERNQLKSDTLDALAVDLTSGMEVIGRCKEGIIVAFNNEIEGAIYAVVDVVIKDLDYDPDTYLQEYADALTERAEREAKRAKARK